MFFDNLLYDAISDTSRSCNQMAIETQSRYGVDITKQGIDHRFSEGAQKYIHSLIGEVLRRQVNQSLDIGWLKSFNRVIVKDSSKFDLNARVKNKLPGFGGSASEAGVCLQYEFDIKSGYVNDLNIMPANSSDSKNALSTIDTISKGDLTIRDLGYFVTEYFEKISEKGAFFLSRLNTSVSVYKKNQNGELKELNFGVLYQNMMKQNIKTLDMDVFIHRDKKLPVRLIIEPVSEEVYNQRIKKIGSYNKKKGHQLTQSCRDRSRFNLFITNIPSDNLDKQTIIKIYKVRWQIELVFKIWKSIFGLDNVAPMKYERLMASLNAKLLIVLVNWQTIIAHRYHLFNKKERLLSLIKCFKTLKDNGHQLRNVLTNGMKGIEIWMKWNQEIFKSKHWLETKKNKLGFIEILSLNIL
jgi:hypothetical protein